MAKNKFFTKILIVLSATAILLAACGKAQSRDPNYDAGFNAAIAELVPGNPRYESIKAQILNGLVPGNVDYENLKTQILTANPAPACPVVDQASCTSVVDANPEMCSAQVATAQVVWVPNQTACSLAGFGYPAMTIDSALTFVKANGYHCYTPVVVLPTATPKPKIKREEPPPAPPCASCPVPPVETPCATCPVPPGD